jgi:hypothetical protein
MILDRAKEAIEGAEALSSRREPSLPCPDDRDPHHMFV